MKSTQVLQAWGRVLTGYLPVLAIEVTRECPLHCPGCYAYEDAHLGGGVTLRQLTDYKGKELVEGILRLVERYRPLHVSLSGATRWFATERWRFCYLSSTGKESTSSSSPAPSVPSPPRGRSWRISG